MMIDAQHIHVLVMVMTVLVIMMLVVVVVLVMVTTSHGVKQHVINLFVGKEGDCVCTS